MHSWGDEWFQKHGDELYAAIDWIASEYQLRTGNRAMMKEKWGTIRTEFLFSWFTPGCWPIHELFKPGYLWYTWPKFFMPVDTFVGQALVKMGIAERCHRKQMKIVKQVFLEAVTKWPHLRTEILMDISSYDEIMGQAIHDEFWRKV